MRCPALEAFPLRINSTRASARSTVQSAPAASGSSTPISASSITGRSAASKDGAISLTASLSAASSPRRLADSAAFREASIASAAMRAISRSPFGFEGSATMT